jgi:RNA polymerase sigma-70 factor (ECF subfamily)
MTSLQDSPQLLNAASVIYDVATMVIDSDLELMLRVRRGEAEPFEELLRRHRVPLVNYFARMLRDRALAEDLAQEAFLRVYQARKRYQPEARFSTWLYRIATNLALNAIRDRKGENHRTQDEDSEGNSHMAVIPDGRPTAEHELILTDRERMIREAVQALPGNQRAAVVLHKYQDVDYRQIAKLLGVSESAVKSLLFRAYESLRVRLEPLFKGGQL